MRCKELMYWNVSKLEKIRLYMKLSCLWNALAGQTVSGVTLAIIILIVLVLVAVVVDVPCNQGQLFQLKVKSVNFNIEFVKKK